MGDHDVSQHLDAVVEPLAIFQAAIDGQMEILRMHTEMLTALWREAMKEPDPSGAVQAIERLSPLMTTRLDRISAAVEAWQSVGRAVWGAVLAWRQSDLLHEAGPDEARSRALSRLIRRIQSGQIALTDRSIGVVDERGLIGTYALLELVQLCAQHGFSIVATYDQLQAQTIDAGGVILLLQRVLGETAVPSPERSVRQRRRRDRATALLFRPSNAAAAIARKRADGTITLAPGRHADAVRRVAALWEDRIRANRNRSGYTLTVNAPTNSDARAIAREIRARRRRIGQVGIDVITRDAAGQAGIPFAPPLAVSDRVRRLHSVKVTAEGALHRRNLGHNGTVTCVTGLRDQGLVQGNDGGAAGFVPFEEPRDQATGRALLTSGDVLSIDTIQSAISTAHIDAMPAGTKAVQRFKAYVAGWRSRQTTRLVLSDGAGREEIAHRRPLSNQRPIKQDEVFVNVARTLSRQPESERAMQDVLQRGESRQARG